MRRRILGIAGLEPEWKRSLFAIQMQYYFDNFQGELLDRELEHMDWEQVLSRDRGKFIEYCAVRHKYEKGMEGLMMFGWEGMDPRRVLKIAGHAFVGAGEDVTLTKLAWYIFRAGEFDKPVLMYLCDYYSGMQVLVPLDLTLAGTTAEAVAAALADYYKDAATVKVHGLNEPLPENGLYSNAMAGTDRMELYLTVNAAGDQMMLVSVFDNLGKGSSGAAVQCMNLMQVGGQAVLEDK